MTWNLRLVDLTDEEQYPYVEICEVYYDQLGKPLGYSTATMGGENRYEIKEYLLWAMEALDKPVLKFKDNHENRCKDSQ